jgi:S-DNA-T family DNA segregation ATPase FtsK/SpoIIIE
MSKKKKQTRGKKAEVEKERSALWPLVGATTLCIIALFVLLGGFGTGGTLPKNLFHGAYWLLGMAAFLVPVALVYWAMHKFQDENHKIPKAEFISMLAVLVLAASGLQTAFASKTEAGVWAGGHGGALGRVVGNGVLGVLDKVPASLVLFVLALLALGFAFGITLSGLLNFFHHETSEEEMDLAQLKAQHPNNFQLNEGVPVEHHAPAKLTNLKNTAQKLGASQDHSALTLASDPDWKFPGIELLNQKQDKADAGDVEGNARVIQETMANFNIEVEMEGANIGPRVTQYTLKPPAGVKLTKIAALDNNLALDLAAQSIRIEAPIPGKKAVGIEVPNIRPATVRLSSIFSSNEWQGLTNPLGIAVGKDISGTAIVGSLDRMPHMLVAGQTNSGKSVMIHSILTSLLYRNSPSDLKLILVDPKHVELKAYDEIPHLLTPVITEPEKCISALKWATAEMERRYRTLAEAKMRNIGEYNQLKKEEGMPYIVIVIDELADLMMMAARDVEALIVRIAQKARAVGIHLVLATQSPRVTVITGLIKANIPARVAFTVSQEVESRIILDQSGAEKLLGMGDMLFSTAEMPKPKRVQGALVEGDEVTKVTDFLRMQRGPQYDDEIISQQVQIGKGGVVSEVGGDEGDDDMWRDAVHVVLEARKASTSLLQRRLRIGYGRAARLIETMEEQGIIGPADGSRPRDVLVNSMDEVFGDGAPAGEAQNDVYDEIPEEA